MNCVVWFNFCQQLMYISGFYCLWRILISKYVHYDWWQTGLIYYIDNKSLSHLQPFCVTFSLHLGLILLLFSVPIVRFNLFFYDIVIKVQMLSCCQLQPQLSLLNFSMFFSKSKDIRADVVSGHESPTAWSLFITYSLCCQSKQPLVIIVLHAFLLWVMEWSTINNFARYKPSGSSTFINSQRSLDDKQTPYYSKIHFDVF